MPGIDYTIGAKISGFTSGIKRAMGGLQGLAGGVAKIAGPVAAIAGVASLGAVIGKAIGKAAELETLQTAFQPLLGSADAAKARIDELSKFAASTPFELPEIASASKTLETLTRGALSTGAGLTLVGDVAAATGRPFDEMSTIIGRLYDGLDSGRPVGEALARLQELGVISGDTRGKLEGLQKEGVKGADAWAVAEAAMGKFGGGMKLQSGTWNGLMSTLKDNIGNALASFGAPIIDNIKPFLQGAGDVAGKMAEKAAKFGQMVGEAIGFIAAAFQTGNVTTIIAEGLKLAFLDAVNSLFKAMRATISAVGQYILEAFKTAVTYIEVLTTADFWKGMGNALIGMFKSAVSFLMKGLAKAMEVARPLAELFGKGDTITGAQEALRGGAKMIDEEAAALYAEAGDQLGPLGLKLDNRWMEAGENIAGRFQETFANTADVIDTSTARGKLDGAVADVRRQMAANKAAAEAAKDAVTSALPKPDEGTPPAAGKAASQVQADRLRQIGGYVGGGLAAAKDRLAEKTEQWTRKTAEATAKMAKKLTQPTAPAPRAGASF